MRNQKSNQWLQPLIFAIIALAAMYWWHSNLKKDDRSIIEDPHALVIGYISRFDVIGVTGSKLLKYQYFVEGVEYEGSVICPEQFKECISLPNRCNGIKFNVLYKISNPSMSLIKPVWNNRFEQDFLETILLEEYK